MKKLINILLCNITIFYIIITISNNYINKNIYSITNFLSNHNPISNRINSSKINIDNYPTEEFIGKRLDNTDSTYLQFCGDDRQIIGINYTNKPIIILGCSYAYGHGLKTEETFPYKLSEITQRPIYNFALCGDNAIESLKHLNKFVEKNKKNKQLISNAEYVIYVYMYDHINRYLKLNFIYEYYNKIYPFHNKFEEKLINIPTIKLLCSLYQINKVVIRHDKKNTDFYYNFLQNSEQHLKKIMNAMHNEIKQYSPNAKIIIIVYDQKIAKIYKNLEIKYDMDMQNSPIWDEINNESDMTIVHSKDITGFLFDKNYKLKEDIADWHPNKKAWEVFTPEFAEKYIK